MFTVYHSNQVDVLKSLLVELIRRDPLENPFAKEHILVQSSGMSQWLKMELAKELKIVANVDFPLPAAFIWQLFTQVLQDVPAQSAFNKESMCWKLMKLLPQQLSKPAFEPLANYLDCDPSGTKLYQLAEKVADTFDGYLVYRPEWIATWEAGKTVVELADDHPWQPILWQELYDYTLQIEQSPFHRANLYEHFIDSLENYSGSLDFLPKRLFVFGISSLPPRYLDALKAIGQHIDVHLMFTNPCRYYWGEVRDKKFLAKLSAKHRQHVEWQQESSKLVGTTEQLKGSVEQNIEDALHVSEVGNSLLASMGKLGRDNLFLLSQLEANEIEAFVDVDRDSLLHQLQADILNLEEHQDDEAFESSTHKQVIDSGDRSFTIHACHSPLREVEVLHDQLLTMFNSDHSLTPRDIIVMVADINSYSPAIQAVFSNAPTDRYIPFSISDLSADVENPILKAFVRLVELPASRCSSSELLEILETPAILAKMNIGEEEFDCVRQWVEESGVRWGLDENTSTEFDLPKIKQNTWQFGIQRMLLGYAMSEEIGLFNHDDQDYAPYDEVQGLQAELAGKIALFIDLVSSYRQRLSGSQSIEAWKNTLFELVDDFFEVDVEGDLALKTIRDVLVALQDNIVEARFEQALPANIIAQYLKDKLSGTRVSQRFLAGQVNFCTLMPMRSIPFKVVCLLGMNDGVYPRSIPPESFDLLVGRSKPGDRSRRIDDRYLFLEAMLSAQQCLYISYVGRSIEKNTEKVPSVLVSELTDYCQQNYCLQGDEQLSVDESGERLIGHISQFHAMTPFSPNAFSQENGSYAKEWLPAANMQGLAEPQATEQLDDFILSTSFPFELELKELQKFWKLPVRYFFNRRLKVYFHSEHWVPEDEEPFTLNSLQGYQLREQLLEQLVKSAQNKENLPQSGAEYMQKQRAYGNLPVGEFGTLEFEQQREKVQPLYEMISGLCSRPEEDIDVVLPIELDGPEKQITLTGWLSQNYQSGLVRYRTGSLRSVDFLAAWIDHLCAAAIGEAKTTHLIGMEGPKLAHKAYPAIDDSQYAKQQLSILLNLYVRGMNQPLCYFPKTALTQLKTEAGKGKKLPTEEEIEKKMADEFNGNQRVAGEGSDIYISRLWPVWNQELSQHTRAYSHEILKKALENVVDGRELAANE